MNKNALAVSVKYGVRLGILMVLSNFVIVNLSLSSGPGIMTFLGIGLLWIAKLGILARSHYEFNEKNNDFISFKDAIFIGLIVLGISSAMSVTSTFINYQFIIKQELDTAWRIGEGSNVSATKIILLGALSSIAVDVIVLFFIITMEALWKIFKKAGKEGWASLVPIYNTITMLDIVGKPAVWFLLMFIPIVNVVLGIWVVNLLAKRFGKSESYTIGLLLLPFVFYPLLGLSEQQMIPYGEE
ncbi:MAG TPA: DUF4199 family protein [Chryseolinea sp.]|nr:DUF4199 family protein [Chryseolinea sp.]